MSFANLNRNRNAIDQLVKAAEATNTTQSTNKYTDDRIWKPTVDKSNNGYAVIRFLPASEGSELPWNRYWDHGFKGPTGRWYIERSLTSIGQTDPVGELNSKLWNSGIESDKEVARKQKRRLHHVSNILVVSDPGNPANEGKVFLFQYGKKIFDKLMDAMQPEFQDEDPINPFDFWSGANFKLKIRDVEGYRNYDKSDFDTPGALQDDDTKLEQVWNSEYSLQEFIGADQFKSYDDLKTKLYRVLALGETNTTEEVATAPVVQEAAPASIPTQAVSSEPQLATADSEDDDAMAFFQKLAQ